MFCILTLSLFSICFAAPFTPLESRIVNGLPIEASKFPWMVSLRSDLYHFCGASLINIDPIVMLSAAHCLDSFRYDETLDSVVFWEGNNDTFQTELFADLNRTYPGPGDDVEGDRYQTLFITDISSIILHPSWTGDVKFGYDVALIILDDSQTVNGISTAMLPTLPEFQLDGDVACCADGEALTAIGYGLNSTLTDITETLEETTLNFLSLTECSEMTMDALGIRFSDFFDESLLCVIGDNTDICKGDSGGPILRMDTEIGVPEIVGVASIGGPAGFGCNSGIIPSGFMSTAHFVDWIQFTAYGPPQTSEPTSEPTVVPTTQEPTQSDSNGSESMRFDLAMLTMITAVCAFAF